MKFGWLVWLLCCGACRAEEQPGVYVLSSLATVRPRATPVAGAAREARLAAARGEWEAFQLLVRAGGRPLALDVEAGALDGPNGARLPAPRLYRVGFVDLRMPSSVEGAPGKWPDPLIPAVDAYAGERRNAFPVAVGAGDDATAWIELFVPREAAPGIYRGAATVRDGGRAIATVPITLTVHRFALPATSSLPVTFGFSSATAARAHLGRAPSDAEALALARRYALAALRHRVSLHGGTMTPAPFTVEGGRVTVDFAPYDAEVADFLDGTADRGGPADGARWTALDLRVPLRLDGDARAAYVRALVDHLRARGWLDRAFAYLADEPAPADFPSLRTRAAALAAAAPSLPRLVTHALDPGLAGAVDLWCAPLNLVDDKPDGAGGPPRAAYPRLWWYQSCLSHGCDVVGGAYFTGWPSYAIDAPAVAHRIEEWLTFRYGVGGELYYNTVEAYDGDPFRDPLRHGGNGDGTLFYPGRPDRIGGASDVPVESIRLKRIRDGLEDYEYLAAYARRFGRPAAERIAAGVAERTFRWQHDPERLLAARAALARALDAGDAAPSARRGAPPRPRGAPPRAAGR